jgi:hypothetical protein
MLNSRRPKSLADIEAARSYASEFSLFAGWIAATMRANRSSRTIKAKKTKAVVSRTAHGWWKAEFYRQNRERARPIVSHFRTLCIRSSHRPPCASI